MAILNQFSATLLYQARDSGNSAIRASQFCAAKGVMLSEGFSKQARNNNVIEAPPIVGRSPARRRLNS